jgi:BMFP domain-containing protein YqiC
MKSNKLAIISLALSFTLPLSINKQAMALVPANEMRDLSSNHWAYKAIEALVEKYGVMSGYPDKTFKGSRNLTRYEMAAALYKVMTKVEELIASSNRPGYNNMDSGSSSVSREDLETLTLLQKEFRNEIADLKGKVEILSEKVENFNKVKIGGQIELKYRDRVAVTDSTKTSSPLNTVDVDGDKGITKFNDSVRNLVTQYDRTPFRVKTTIDISASLNPGIRYYGSFVADDGTVFKLGTVPGQAVGGHFGEEGLSGNSLYPQHSVISIRNNFEDEELKNASEENIEMKPLSSAGNSFYHENKPGYGVAMGFMNFRNIVRPGTKLKNHFESEKWIGHGYGLVGFGSDDVMVKDNEVKSTKDGKEVTEIVRNSVSRFWASGINVSRVDPDSQRYNNVSSPAVALDYTSGPFTVVVVGNAGSPYVNRIAALTSNIGSGSGATVNTPAPKLTTQSFDTKSSPSGILTGVDFVGDTNGGLINQKVIVGTKDVLNPRTTSNLIDLPSEYGDGYGLIGVDLDLGSFRVGLNASDYWLDSTFSLSGTRKNFSGVIDLGSNDLGVTLQANYQAIGIDTYSAAVVMNDVSGLDFGLGFKTGTRGFFNFGSFIGTNLGVYVVLPEQKMVPKLMFAARQTFGDNFGSPVGKDASGNSFDLLKVSSLKDSGITISAAFDQIPGTSIGLELEYNALVEGPLWSFNFMAHDIGIFTNYKF